MHALHARPGDEYAQTRGGNNNWYGHDTKMTRFDWDALEAQRGDFFRFYRRSHPPCLCFFLKLGPCEGSLGPLGCIEEGLSMLELCVHASHCD